MRSNYNTARSPLASLASLMSWVTMPVCSRQPGTPGMPPFYTDVSMYLLLNRKLESLLATMLKKKFAFYTEQEDDSKLVDVLRLLFWDVHSLRIPP